MTFDEWQAAAAIYEQLRGRPYSVLSHLTGVLSGGAELIEMLEHILKKSNPSDPFALRIAERLRGRGLDPAEVAKAIAFFQRNESDFRLTSDHIKETLARKRRQKKP
jgi:hypothetical protein